ncbi:MAG TPA: beta-ribofuranosylaminobenzene 5'-phosphate synthase family protein [Xanthobacteraceae bacterium]|nr:beta-ribofuranosylaminobenzene 5'-phosphate synthase family protein [Xanthobacteraceae bacterium]
MSRSAPIADSVTVSVPARLHLGFMDLHGGLGRRFGGIGLALRGLGTTLTISPAAHMQVEGPEHERARNCLDGMRRLLDLSGAYRLTIEETVPAHAGLGSGTQIALAVAAGVRRLHDLPLDVARDAIQLGRGLRSGAGIGLFARGGLIVDGGRGADGGPAPVICHMPVPESWGVLVLLDPARQGLHGREEAAAFAALPPLSAEEAAHSCRLVMMKLLPALAERDLANFADAIKELQMRLGDYYAPVQGGGRFTSPDVAAALTLLEREGALGIGQSSWGPTGFAFAPSQSEATRLATRVRHAPEGRGLDIRVCAALNRGADIEVRAAARAHQA